MVFCQAEACLGQQIIHDSRLPPSDFGRVFPHDPKYSANVVSQGLLFRESFIEGLSPKAFFIHAIAATPGASVGAAWRAPGP